MAMARFGRGSALAMAQLLSMGGLVAEPNTREPKGPLSIDDEVFRDPPRQGFSLGDKPFVPKVDSRRADKEKRRKRRMAKNSRRKNRK